MKKYKLNNGVEIPALGLGTYKSGEGESAAEAVKFAIESGYRLIDCAASYGNEKAVGEGIRFADVDREDLFVTSKVWNTERGYDSTLSAFDKTQKDLGLEYLDLYLIHWPASESRFADWKEINRSTWKALERLYSEGLVRAIGVSNFMPHHLEPLMMGANVKPAVDQIEVHPGFMQKECVEFCRKNDIIVEAWSPLGRGRMFDSEVLKALSQKYGKSLAQICLRWEIQNGIVPLPKSVTPQRIIENIEVFDFELTEEDMQAINEMPQSGESGLDPDKITF